MEVFAVQVITKTESQLERICGLVLLRGSEQNYVLYEDPCDKRGRQYNSEGCFTLIGPECGVEVKDTLIIYPWLFDKYNATCDWCKGKFLWKRDPHLPRTDQVIRKGIRCNAGIMQVDFAIYDDGVEVRIEITLLDLELEGMPQLGKSLEIYGTVKASNSVIIDSEARSTLFDHITSQECIKLPRSPSDEAEIHVPLTRNLTVIPRNSTLIVDVDLSLCCNPQGKSLAAGSVTFDARSRSSCTVEQKIILGAHAKVKVKAIWST